MKPITTSFFEIFKVGPGPSSSHTIGPMNASLDFRASIEALDENIIKKATHISIYLYGALSATGKGHGTDRAILAGLMGIEPAYCDSKELLSFFENKDDSYKLDFKGKQIIIDRDSFSFAEIHHLFPYSNTMILKFMSRDDVILEKEYYSIGGGFIECKGEEKKDVIDPLYKYSSFNELKKILKKEDISIETLLLENEKKLTLQKEEKIFENLYHIIDVMNNSVERGIKKEGVLPGPIKLKRRASTLFAHVEKDNLNKIDNFFILLDAYALAVSEENAAGYLVVTAPTSGSCGIIPSIVYLLANYFKKSKKEIAKALMIAAVIGFVSKHNASISGAEVGCQGEIGVASSMGAGMLAHINGGSIEVIDNAAKIALKHFLGLTCDPLKGYVQIPCIERNAAGAAAAYNSYLLALYGDPKKQKLSFDQVVEAMLKTGKDMCIKYKETSKGGLALSEVEC